MFHGQKSPWYYRQYRISRRLTRGGIKGGSRILDDMSPEIHGVPWKSTYYLLSVRSYTHRVITYRGFWSFVAAGEEEGKSYGRFVGALFKRLITGAFLISAINQNFQLALGITSGAPPLNFPWFMKPCIYVARYRSRTDQREMHLALLYTYAYITQIFSPRDNPCLSMD